MIKIPQNIQRIPAKVALDALKSLRPTKSCTPIKDSQFKKLIKGTKLAQNPSSTLSRQEYEGLRNRIIQKGGLKISQTQESKAFQKESKKLDEERKRGNIAYLRQEKGKKRGELMAKRLHGIETQAVNGTNASSEETFYDSRIKAIKNPHDLTNNADGAKEEKDKKPTVPAKPTFVEPPDMFL